MIITGVGGGGGGGALVEVRGLKRFYGAPIFTLIFHHGLNNLVGLHEGLLATIEINKKTVMKQG